MYSGGTSLQKVRGFLIRAQVAQHQRDRPFSTPVLAVFWHRERVRERASLIQRAIGCRPGRFVAFPETSCCFSDAECDRLWHAWRGGSAVVLRSAMPPDKIDCSAPPACQSPGALPIVPPTRTRWTAERCAWLGFLIGQGWEAKRIADDPLIRSTPNNVYRQAHRLGLSFASTPTAASTLRLPIATGAVYERAARQLGVTRDAMIRRTVIAMASDPAAIDRLAAR